MGDDPAGGLPLEAVTLGPVDVLLLALCPPDAALRLTETLASPPPLSGTQPPELSSLVITWARTLTR